MLADSILLSLFAPFLLSVSQAQKPSDFDSHLRLVPDDAWVIVSGRGQTLMEHPAIRMILRYVYGHSRRAF